MKKLSIPVFILGSLFILPSCNNEPHYSLSQLQEEVGDKVEPLETEKENQLKAILNSIFPKGWKVLKIFKVTTAEEPYLKKYLVKVYSPYEHLILNKFVWLTKDGKILFSTAYQIEANRVSVIVPKHSKEYPIESLRWILDVERIALEGNLPITLTKGSKVVYLVWNPYCKKCFDRWKDIVTKAQQLNVSIKLIPYHNVYYPIDNLYMLIFLLWKAQNDGLFNVVNNYYSQSGNFEDFLSRLKKDAFTYIGKIPKNAFNSIGFSLKEISQTLQVAKIYVVPTTVLVKKINPTIGLAEGYVLVNKITFKEPKMDKEE